jgi:hypothetical protein
MLATRTEVVAFRFEAGGDKLYVPNHVLRAADDGDL